VEAFLDVVGDRHVDALGDPPAVEQAAQNPRGDGADQAEDDDQAHRGVEQPGRGDRSRMRGQQAVHDGQPGGQRKRVVQHALAAPLGGGVDHRSQHDDADVEEHRDAEHQPGQAEGQWCPVLAEQAEQPVGDLAGAARHLQHLAEHGAQADDRRDVRQNLAHAAFHVGHDLGQRDAGGDRDHGADQQQRDERVQPDLDDQDQQGGDADCGDGQQVARGTGHGRPPGIGRGARAAAGADRLVWGMGPVSDISNLLGGMARRANSAPGWIRYQICCRLMSYLSRDAGVLVR
jgi:hypothetical protein